MSAPTTTPPAPAGVSTEAKQRRRLAPDGEVLVGFVGRLAAEKRVEDLRALNGLPGVRVVVIGEGPEDEALRRARTRKIQRSSWITNALLHLPDGPGLAERDRRMACFPEDFGWIHGFDALQSAGGPSSPSPSQARAA